jgi:predicted AAA+ superfamily ATPase
MAISNYERVGKAMEALKLGLAPFVSREFINHYKGQARQELERITDVPLGEKKPFGQMDVAALLKVMWDSWNEVFRHILGRAERSLVTELQEARNRWAHQSTFSSDDTYRALDSTHRLLTSVSSPQANDIDKLKTELLRVRFEEQTRTERRRATSTAIESQGTTNLKPWREVITPHTDVATGRYQQAEFAADLWQVHMGEGSDEYRDPVEFFRRTYLTESLKRLLVTGVQRLSGKGGDPVVQLQTNFGGGKTHSMLAIYHLFSGVNPSDMAGVTEALGDTYSQSLPSVNRVVLDGTKIDPGSPVIKSDGTEVRTLWGEIAWQLGGKEAFQRIQDSDQKATNPGDAIRELMNDYGPCLILIDEWVAYARQLHEQKDLPAGDFETHFTFAQNLTTAARAANSCLLLISLPSSEASVSPHAQADDVEVGGERGRTALDRLGNAVGRVEATWRPANAEEGFEIVRRRLFEPMVEREQFVARDMVTKAFSELYQTQHQEFPPECREADYEKRMTASYPIHPEVFDRLYEDWSTLVKFQRTRGVLRLMAAVIHCLWEKGDRNPLIMPSNISIDDPTVQFELTRYLSDNWVPIIEKDVDGPNALPLTIDAQVPNLGKFAAARRVARTIYLGSAPTTTAANVGIEDRRVKLGCVMPGEPPAIFVDALRRLSSTATYLYQDGVRFWYSTQPTVTKLADDRAEVLTRSPEKVAEEIEKRLRLDLRQMGEFSRVHPLPHSGQDVPDATDTGLVVLGLDHPYSREPNSPGEVAAKQILESRGNNPRMYRNTLVFLAVDKTRLQDLDEATRRHLAWDSILNERGTLDLTQNQVIQAETQKSAADSAITARITEAYQWLLVPTQSSHNAPMVFQAIQLRTPDGLAVRASKRLRKDELLVTRYGSTLLRQELDKARGSQDHALWRGGNHVSVRQLVEDFASYLYLQRLRDPSVLTQAVQDGIALMTWEQDAFAYAESYDEGSDRYRGLRYLQQVSITDNDPGVIVRPEVARKQIDAETVTTDVIDTEIAREPSTSSTGLDAQPGQSTTPISEAPKANKRYHGSVKLDPTRAGRDASVIADEVIAHLAGLMGTNIKVTLEIEAEIPDGAPEQVVRTVNENSRTLKFEDSGFEEE